MPEYLENSFQRHGARAFNPSGFLSSLSDELELSQAIVLPPGASIVMTSGQCGFLPDGSLPAGVEEQVMLAFANADATLKEAGVSDGWKSVYQITTYTPALTDEWVAAVRKAKGHYLGKNRPAWTGVTVPSLYGGAVIEITINAFIAPKNQ